MMNTIEYRVDCQVSFCSYSFWPCSWDSIESLRHYLSVQSVIVVPMVVVVATFTLRKQIEQQISYWT